MPVGLRKILLSMIYGFACTHCLLSSPCIVGGPTDIRGTSSRCPLVNLLGRNWFKCRRYLLQIFGRGYFSVEDRQALFFGARRCSQWVLDLRARNALHSNA